MMETETRLRSTVEPITGWAGPWPLDERWWAADEASPRMRFQVSLADGRALLLTLTDSLWRVTGVYD